MTLILVAVYIVANLLSDIFTILLTPRLRTEATDERRAAMSRGLSSRSEHLAVRLGRVGDAHRLVVVGVFRALSRALPAR